MVDVTEGRSVQQTHNGIGPQVGRDLNGNVIYEQLSPKVKAAIEQLSEDTPALNRLLQKALRNGLISPDLVRALQGALNEDVLHVLTVVAQHINEDTAMELHMAGETINKVVTIEFPAVTRELNDTVEGIKTAMTSLSAMIGKAGAHGDDVSRTGGRQSFPSPRSRNKWLIISTLISASSGFGLIAAITLMLMHMERYAICAAVSMVLMAVVFGIRSRNGKRGPEVG